MNERVTITESFYDITISEWLVEYRLIVEAYPVSAKTLANRQCSIDTIERWLGGESLLFIKPYVIANAIKDLSKDHPATAKRVLIELKNMFKEALIYDKTSKNQAIFIRAPKVAVQRMRLTFEEWRAIYTAAYSYLPYWVSRLLLLALSTGQRRSDVIKFRRCDIYDDYLHVTQQKTGAMIAIPLSLSLQETRTTLAEVIASCEGEDYLLVTNRERPPCAAYASQVFEVARRLAGVLKNVSLHECRSLAERLYSAQGVNTRLLLGHTSWRMTDEYHNDRGLSIGTYNFVTQG